MKRNEIKKLIFVLIILCFTQVSFSGSKNYLLLEGLIPSQYVRSKKGTYVQGAIVINRQTRLIENLETNLRIIDELKRNENYEVIILKRGRQWDVIYPGLIDLHNHTKQNNLGVWQDAKGQFSNRFEWRAWSSYKKAVSGNMNPWIGFGTAINCAAFRWSEIQALVVGTTYLQGPSSCVDNFAIQRVEDQASYVSKKSNVQAPTDLVVPNDMVFVWNTLGPIIRDIQKKNDNNKTSESYRLAYEEAFSQVVNQYCDFSKKGILIDRNTVRGEALEHLSNKELLEEVCQKVLPDKFIRYVYWVHKPIIGKKLYAESIVNGEGSAIIAHLGEGRREDYYNNREFELVELLGMDQKNVNFVHGVGVTSDGLKTMGEKQMGLIWSPYSNLLLYNQTLDIKKVTENNVLLALGSDWLPTGSKGPLEELKVARNYILKMKLEDVLKNYSDSESFDEALYKMVTENPAKMINHWQNTPEASIWDNGEVQGGIGTLAVNAMGTVIVTSKLDENPYTNLVEKVWESDINLVVVDGHVQYGNESYLNQSNLEFEMIDNGEHDMENLQSQEIPTLSLDATGEQEEVFLAELGRVVTQFSEVLKSKSLCQWAEEKGLVYQNSIQVDKGLMDFKNDSGLNLDRFKDIQRLIGINIMTQSLNRVDPERGDVDYQLKDFTPLLTCNDPYHYNRLVNFVHADPNSITDEFSINEKNRAKLIQEQGLGSTSERLEDKYPQPN